MAKRSGRFYRKNEADVMSRLGLKPTINSGSGWIEKEDGQSEDVICQLKSTDASSIKVNLQDLDTLQYNAMVAHKLPVFAVQFLQCDEVYLVVKPSDLQDIAKYLQTGEAPQRLVGIDLSGHEDCVATNAVKVKTSPNGREEFRRVTEYKRGKRSKSAL